MSPEMTAAIIGLTIILLAALNLLVKQIKPKRLNQDYFQKQWEELLTQVRTPEGMNLAVINADKLLDEALKKLGYKGKTMGERLVSAQRQFSDNDLVWFAHKLRNKLVHESGIKLRRHDAQQALKGFRQGLRDLGALK